MEAENKLYSQRAIAIATYFGGPLAAGILVKKNCLNLGKPDQARNALFIGIISMLLIFAIPNDLLENIPNFVIPTIYTGIIYLIVKQIQGKELDEHKEKGGEFYSAWKATKIGAISMIIFLAGFVFVAFISGDFENTRADFDTEKYDIEVAKFIDNEKRALAVFSVLESSDHEFIIKEFNKAEVIWKQNKSIIDNLLTFNNLPQELIDQNKKLIEYCDLRIEHTRLFIKGISEDTDKYVPEIDRIGLKIQNILAELHE